MENFAPPGGWLVIAVVAWAAFMLGRATQGGGSSEARTARRLRDEEAAVAAVSGLSPSLQSDIDRLLIDRKLIEAIKVIRNHTGLGLKDSKFAAEQRLKQIKG